MTYQANQRNAELKEDERRAKESALSMYNDGLAVEKISRSAPVRCELGQ